MRLIISTVLVAVFSVSTTAQAQFAVTVLPSIIGNTVGMMAAADTEASCMNGVALPDKEIAEARGPSIVAIQQYFATTQASDSKAVAFHLDGKTRWRTKGVEFGMADLDAAHDPLALPGHVIRSEPLRFYRSGMEPTALGQWAVLDSGGAIAGVYTAMLVRKSGVWKLRSLDITQAGDKIEAARQFCHMPGDVLKYRVKTTTMFREMGEKRLQKATARVAAASPQSPDLARLRAFVEKRQVDLAKLRDAERDAQQDAVTALRETVDVREAMGFASTR